MSPYQNKKAKDSIVKKNASKKYIALNVQAELFMGRTTECQLAM